jgi:methyl-accepting chemotaxis protein
MKAGTLPPQLPGRASKEYVAIMAEAKRQGFDLASAATDWTATQKHIATMNGAQQLRLNQSINALPDMLDSVDALASKWKGGKFPILNKANLALAKGGAYGSDVASIANQLDAQIADVTADLGNVYMGGNSPNRSRARPCEQEPER